MEAIGVDLGGTKMGIGVFDEHNSKLWHRETTSAGLAEAELVSVLVAELEAAREACPRVGAIGLGIPCTIDRETGRAISAVNLPIHDLPLREIAAERLGLPVSVDNDGNVAALAEQRCGAATGMRNVVMATVGTGIGGGLVVDGELFRGARGAGAELGHTVIDHQGPKCQGHCPNHGCVEVLASGTALGIEGTRQAREDPGSALAAVLREGGEIHGRAVTQAAVEGDSAARQALAVVGRRLGAAMSSWANIFEPEAIVVGGGVTGGAGDLLLGPAREELRWRALPPMNETPVLAAALGPEAGMIGAAVQAREEAGA